MQRSSSVSTTSISPHSNFKPSVLFRAEHAFLPRLRTRARRRRQVKRQNNMPRSSTALGTKRARQLPLEASSIVKKCPSTRCRRLKLADLTFEVASLPISRHPTDTWRGHWKRGAEGHGWFWSRPLASSVMMVLRQFNLVIAPNLRRGRRWSIFFLTVVLRDEIALSSACRRRLSDACRASAAASCPR